MRRSLVFEIHQKYNGAQEIFEIPQMYNCAQEQKHSCLFTHKPESDQLKCVQIIPPSMKQNACQWHVTNS